jgi:hypothetical protein
MDKLEMDTALNDSLAACCLTEEILVELDFEDWLEANHVYVGNLNSLTA